MKTYYGYVYKTTNNINGKIYIGRHKRNYIEGRNTEYYGSGKMLLAEIDKYGIENFTNEIIEWCASNEQLNERERYWIKELKSLYIYGNYNMAKGGIGGSAVGPANNWSGTSSNKFGKNNPFYGLKHTEETKQKISISKKGSIPPNKGKTCTEEEKEKSYYNRVFTIKCKTCSKEFNSHASGTRYCTLCKQKKELAFHYERLEVAKNFTGRNKEYFIDKRLKQIQELKDSMFDSDICS